MQIGPLAIHWYGVAWAIAVLWLRYVPIRFNCLPQRLKDHWFDYIDLGLIAVIFGGRIGWVVFYRPDLLLDPLQGYRHMERWIIFSWCINCGYFIYPTFCE